MDACVALLNELAGSMEIPEPPNACANTSCEELKTGCANPSISPSTRNTFHAGRVSPNGLTTA